MIYSGQASMPCSKHASKPTSTIAGILREAAETLAAVSHSPRLDAEILLAHVTGKNRAHFRAWPEKDLAPEEEAAFWRFVEQRRVGTPVAYLTGRREFWSREFRITPDVLIPRPDTELLIELALNRAPSNRSADILDLGTGSGVIAVTLALERPLARVSALDRSPAALDIAQRNAALHHARNVRFLQSHWFAAVVEDECFDLIVSNPPYIAENDPHLAQGDVRFEPALALSSGLDGLEDIRRIVRDAPTHLAAGGWLLLEHGYDQAEAVRALLMQMGFEAVASYPDLQGHERVSGGRLS
jgi:release factor glutamine methyltransferase